MRICRLKTNRITNPLGFALGEPKLSWTVEEARGTKQEWARVIISKNPNMAEPVYDSAENKEISSLAFAPKIKPEPCTRYYWQVSVCSNAGEQAQSDIAWFETAKLEEPFVGKFIKPMLPYDVCPYMRKSFTIKAKVKSARAYFTGLGIYELYINGEKAGDELLAPGCTAYDKWLQYQSYDITPLLKEGENEALAVLGNGWAKGRFGFSGNPGNFDTGDKGAPSDIFTKDYMLLGDIVIDTQEGRQIVATDESWESAPSPITFSSMYDGERWDGRINPKTSSWAGVSLADASNLGKLTARLSPPVKKMQVFKPQLIHTPKGELVLDVGQVISGFISFVCREPEGTKLRLIYGELLQDDCFYRDNMRSALCEYRYISGGGQATARPVSTFYGFRYVKLEGFVNEPKEEDFEAWAIYSEMETIGNIVTANEKVNRLFENCLWSQRDNFVDVPTDCPQRDERMGWTGDAQAFCPTANFNMDCLPFYTKYGKDMYLDQCEHEGRTPHVTPIIAGPDSMLYQEGGACGWADAATIVPWTTYLFTGDKTILEAQFASMRAWADWVYRHDQEHGCTGLWLETTMHFGDWLALDGARAGFDPEAVIGGTDNTFLCSAYYYYSSLLVSKAAAVLGETDLAQEYKNRAEKTLKAIRHEFYTPGGRCAADTQTGHAFSLFFDLAPKEFEEKLIKRLKRLLKDNNMHLKTGFLGTPLLCRALAEKGEMADAYTLFLQEDLPSWLYEVNMGATTIWERWNSVLPDGKISGISMNSMNHYAYGAIMEWVYRNVCGINPVEKAPGFKEFSLEPQPDKRLGAAKAELSTASGKIVSGWSYEGDNVSYSFTVPFGSTAQLSLSTEGLKNCQINGKPLEHKDGKAQLLLEAGCYAVS